VTVGVLELSERSLQDGDERRVSGRAAILSIYNGAEETT
jgi:hypothetical protein